MMFATLDDLDGAVEIVVFEKALAAAEERARRDAIVLVRGRVDHKEAGKVCVIVAGRRRFDPVRRRDREGQGARSAARPPRQRADAPLQAPRRTPPSCPRP